VGYIIGCHDVEYIVEDDGRIHDSKGVEAAESVYRELKMKMPPRPLKEHVIAERAKREQMRLDNSERMKAYWSKRNAEKATHGSPNPTESQ